MIKFFLVQFTAILFGITYEDGGKYIMTNEDDMLKIDRSISIYLGIFGITVRLKNFA